MSPDFSVVAIVAAYNEADIIEQVLRDLTDQGVQVYFLDDGSTDGTAGIAERFVGRGVLAVEPVGGSGADPAFDWDRILRRKAALAQTLGADWFIHHDADEFRESPWPDLSLSEAIQRVDALGYNAIDFESLDFHPTHDRFKPGDDVRLAFPFYSRRAPYDRVQIRCWKKTDDVDLASSGGHDAQFEDRKVFPLRFILRHYPIRGQAHGERKVFAERRGRFLEAERARGWHVQYNDIVEGASFIRDCSTLTRYDPDGVRFELLLRHRGVEAAEEAGRAALNRAESALAARIKDLNESRTANHQLRAEAAALRAALAEQSAQIATLHAVIQRKEHDVRNRDAALGDLTAAVNNQLTDIRQWRAAVDDLSARLEAFQRSLSWRWTAPARAVFRLFRSGGS
jgi:glycosyltransferase involved in cell wall biosynthesis